MAASEPRAPINRVLVVERDPDVRDHYRLLLTATEDGGQVPLLGGLENEISEATRSHRKFPEFDVCLLAESEACLEELRRAADNRENFALTFVELDGLGAGDPLQVLEQIRQIDPDLQIVALAGASQIDPSELIDRVPPADKVMLLYKPFHGREIQSLALSLTAKWRSERARAASLRVGRTPMQKGEGDALQGLEALPCGLMVFDRHDRLAVVNKKLVELLPELSEFLIPGTRYEEIQWQLAQRLLPEDTLYRVESWVRDRLEWHTAGGGGYEQRLRGPRWIFLAESTADSGETYCQVYDVTDLRRRDMSRATAARLSQIAQALGSFCDQIHVGQVDAKSATDGGKVISLHGGDEVPLSALLPGGQGRIQKLAAKLQTVAQKQRLTPDQTNLNEVIRDVVGELDGSESQKHAIEVIAGAGLWPILIDRGGLKMAIHELIKNADEAVGRRGTIHVETVNVRLDRAFVASRSGLAHGDHVRLSVQDDGPGIVPELAERAFNPFFTSKNDDNHLGLGLSMVHGFMCQSGGYMEIRETSEPGTTVDLYFPRSQVQSGATERDEQSSEA